MLFDSLLASAARLPGVCKLHLNGGGRQHQLDNETQKSGRASARASQEHRLLACRFLRVFTRAGESQVATHEVSDER